MRRGAASPSRSMNTEAKNLSSQPVAALPRVSSRVPLGFVVRAAQRNLHLCIATFAVAWVFGSLLVWLFAPPAAGRALLYGCALGVALLFGALAPAAHELGSGLALESWQVQALGLPVLTEAELTSFLWPNPPRVWRSLALVPAGEGAAPEAMLQLAVSLAHAGMTQLGAAIHIADATRLRESYSAEQSAELAECTQAGDRLLIALSRETDAAVRDALSAGADGSLLCLFLTETRLADARRAVEALGRDHLFGAVVCESRPS